MPNYINIPSGQYIQSGNPDTENVAPPTQLTGGGNPPGVFFPYAAGELGGSFDYNDKSYEMVINDSGATSATPTGAVAAGMVAYWKDKGLRLVTNDRRFAINGQTANAASNSVAGIYRVAAGAGYKICVLTKGRGISVASDGSGGPGQYAVADTTAATARVTNVAVGTAPPYQTIGVMASTPANSLVTVDVNIPNLP